MVVACHRVAAAYLPVVGAYRVEPDDVAKGRNQVYETYQITVSYYILFYPELRWWRWLLIGNQELLQSVTTGLYGEYKFK